MPEEDSRWRRYRVIERVQESANVVSLVLADADGRPRPAFLAGQFLTFRLRTGDGKLIARNYSISSDPADTTCYRISVKRETAPPLRPDLPDGAGSSGMHACAVGSVLEASVPKGRFQLDERSARPVLLLAGGIGITPLLSMAHALARQPSRPVWLVHACENGEVQPFAEELRRLQMAAENLRVVTCLNHPSGEDGRKRLHQFEGQVTAEVLQATLPIGDYDAYLCGPAAFMQAMFDLLIDLGVRENQIRYEFFGAASILRRSLKVGDTRQATLPPLPKSAVATDARTMVTFSASGISRVWDGKHRTLLDFAEAQGLSPAFSCRAGICNTCICNIDGTAEYVDEPLEEPPPGKALLCCSVPNGSVSLEI